LESTGLEVLAILQFQSLVAVELSAQDNLAADFYLPLAAFGLFLVLFFPQVYLSHPQYK
jgi:hypothetical protein